MSTRTYYGSIVTILMSVWFTPGLDELFKVLVLFIVIITVGLISLIFRIRSLREWIVKLLVADVLHEIILHPDVHKIVDWARKKEIEERVSAVVAKSKEHHDENQKTI